MKLKSVVSDGKDRGVTVEFEKTGRCDRTPHDDTNLKRFSEDRTHHPFPGLVSTTVKRISFLLISLVLVRTSLTVAQSLGKIGDYVDKYYTNVGKIGLTVTNAGTMGTRNAYWPNQPSCEYPIGSRVEHLYQAGLWVGAFSRKDNAIHVSTATSDRFGITSGGVPTDPAEFSTEPGAQMLVRSTLSDSRYFSESAISHLDFVADFTDKYTRDPISRDSIFNHTPLGIDVHEESYAWNFPFAEYFVIVSYTIKNVSNDFLDSVYVGLWTECLVRNTNYVRPGTAGYFDYSVNGYDSLARTMYSFEFQPTPGSSPADSYIGISLLGTTPYPAGVDSVGALRQSTYFNAWKFRSGAGTQAYFSPTSDYSSDPYLSRYSRMAQNLPQNYIDPLRTSAQRGNQTTLLSTGPFSHVAPGDSVQVVYAIVCARKDGSELEQIDKPEQRATLYDHLRWAQQTYNADDAANHYVLPAPPRQPKVRAELQSQSVVLYWDKVSAEESVDPISKKKLFEGYRIYRSNPGSDFLQNQSLLLNLQLIGEFDRTDDTVGYNTGFGQVLLAAPKEFPGDTNKYWYRFPPAGASVTNLNGWQYVYGVSAFDQGDPQNNRQSLESASTTVRVVPGTPATSAASADVGVYPNPYYVHAYWDGGTAERLRKIYFYNLPARATITIYTIAGDVVRRIDHDASTYSGNDIDWFSKFGDRTNPPRFSGGEHAWDLISDHDQAIATGLYLFSVKDKDTGTVKTGKFVVIK